MQRLGPRRTLAALALSMTLAACGTSATPAAPTTSPPPASPPATPTAPETPAVDGSAWAAAGTLAVGRANTYAVALADGRVLVVGNDNICTPGGAWEESVEAELYDPNAGTWSPTGSLNAPRTDFAAVRLADGRVLVTGGMTSVDPVEGAFGAYSSAKLYDPATGTWSATGVMGTARTEPAAALLPDGTVLVAGGAYVDDRGNRDLSSAEIYDPETGTWSPTGDMITARRGARAVTLADGRVLVVGAAHGSLASAEIYNPATGSWSPAGSLAQPRDGFALVALPDGGALVAGGAVEGVDIPQATASAERLDPSTLRWSPAASMTTAAAGRSAILLGDGRVLVAGGVAIIDARAEGGATERPPIADAELYDPTTDRWAAAPSLPEPREGGTFVTLADRTVLLVGGDGGYVGEPMTPWCPPPVAEAVRYVPGNLASFPAVKPPLAATLAKSSAARAAAKPADAKKAADSIAAFGIDLYKRMLADGTLDRKKNAVFSPTSIALALGLARAGAKGETAAQMDEVLHVAGWEALGKQLNSLEQALTSRNATWKDDEGRPHELTLRLANAAFAQAGWQIVQGYLDAIASAFGAGLRIVNYEADPEAARQLINAWVKKRTANRIPELLPKEPPVISEATRLVLVNAMYLKANWQREFRGGTEPRTFTRLDGSTLKVPTMLLEQGEQDVPLATGPGWMATELRYLGAPGESGSYDQATPLSMTLIMPDDIQAFEERLTPKTLGAVVAKLDSERKRLARVTRSGVDGDCGTYAYSVRLFMPKLSIATAANLGDPLKAIGMPLAFDREQADFTGIHAPESELDRIYVEEVVHQANIDVDEKGTEAAAATAVVMATGGCTGPDPAKTVTLRLDRPFLFVLRDVETGAILFMGRVVDPSTK